MQTKKVGIRKDREHPKKVIFGLAGGPHPSPNSLSDWS
jgi:hypothetical protein